MNLHMWMLFSITYLGLTISPGPNVLTILTHASKYGLKNIWVIIFANLTCQLIMISLVGLGVSALLNTNTSLYHILKYIGAIYLIYLGFKSLYKMNLSTQKVPEIAKINIKHMTNLEFYKHFGEAFAVSASNPKTIIFLSAFLPQFVSPSSSTFLQFFIMYITIVLIVCTVHTAYAFTLVKMKGKINKVFNSKVLPWISSIIYIALGVSLGISKS